MRVCVHANTPARRERILAALLGNSGAATAVRADGAEERVAIARNVRKMLKALREEMKNVVDMAKIQDSKSIDIDCLRKFNRNQIKTDILRGTIAEMFV